MSFKCTEVFCFFLLSPHFLSQVNTFVVDIQVIGASETFPALFTLMRSLACGGTELCVNKTFIISV